MTDTQVTETGITTFELPAAELARALSNASVWASTDKARPILNAVLLEKRTDTEGMLAVATDQYALVRHTLPLTPCAPFSVVIPLDDCKALVKGLTTNKYAPARVTITGQTFAVECAGTSWTYRTIDGEFPNWRQLWPTEFGTIGKVGLGVGLLAKFSKCESDAGKPTAKNPHAGPVRFSFVSDLKPIVWEIGTDLAGLLMPVRL